MFNMENAALKSAFEKVLALPEDKQAEVADMLNAYVANDEGGSLLTPEQQAIVEERLADPDPNPSSTEDAKQQLKLYIHNQRSV